MKVGRRDSLWWLPLAYGAGLVLLAGASAKKRAAQGPGGAAARARTEGPGDNDVISYVVDTNGTIYVRTQAPDVDWGTPKLDAKVMGDFRAMISHWGSLIDEAGVDYRLPSSQIAGTMWAESNGSPNRTSLAGAKGLMQVMPYHFTAAEQDKMFDPRTNIRKGASLLASARAGFRDLVQMAAAYNAGGPQGMSNGPWTNEKWLSTPTSSGKPRNPALTSRWGYAAEPGYIDRVVAANNTYLQLQEGKV